MEFSAPVTQLKEREGAFIINLPMFKGNTAAILDRIPPETSGMYAWFRCYDFSDDDQQFFDQLLAEIEKPKFYPRSGNVRPYYGVKIESRSYISEVKRQQLRSAFTRQSFVKDLRDALKTSLLFQTPLYIGKASDLKRRIEQHLSPASELRARLSAVSTEIEETLLLMIPAEATEFEQADCSDVENSQDEDPLESLYEEVFSRLFLPQFTIRLG